MSKYDIENLLSDIETTLKADLNTQIAAVEAEKVAAGNGIPNGLPDVSAEAFFEQTWEDKILNYSPAIFFGIEDIRAQGLGPATAETYTIFVEVVVSEASNDRFGAKRIHRYARAIKETIQNKFGDFPYTSNLTIETVRPTSFLREMNSSEMVKVGGVSITTSIACSA